MSAVSQLLLLTRHRIDKLFEHPLVHLAIFLVLVTCWSSISKVLGSAWGS
jgi:hypothetical protein